MLKLIQKSNCVIGKFKERFEVRGFSQKKVLFTYNETYLPTAKFRTFRVIIYQIILVIIHQMDVLNVNS